MACNQTVEGSQTEFEFYAQLKTSPDSSDCCGPKVNLVFNKPDILTLNELLKDIVPNGNYLDYFEPMVIDSRNLRLTMCSRHWFQLSDVLHKASHLSHRQDWNDIAFYVQKVTCLMNAWDEKELVNYLS